MDALKILGSLLGNNAMSSGIGGQILGQLVNGLGQGNTQPPGGNWGGGLGGLLGGLLGGAQQQQPANQGGGLGGLLGGMLGGGQPSGGLGGLGGILGQLAGGGRSQSGGIPWAMLGGLAMAAFNMLGKRGDSAPASLADLSQALAPGGEAASALNEQALILIRAMINAAKADGQIDAQEQQNIVGKLADVNPQEEAFIKEEMAKPLNLDFLSQVAQDMAVNVYMMSLMAINLDTQAEVQYMQQLAQALGLDPQTVNGIHQQLGVTPLYA
jgi:uncharacterized membrane protein YebE (DUF533 family)